MFGRKREKPVIRQPHITDENDNYSFRRSRTLTGSASSKVEAASAKRAQIKSDRLKEHELRAHRRHLGLKLLGTLIVLAMLFGLVQQFTWSLTTYSVTPAPRKDINEVSYQAAVNEYFQTRPLERFRFVLDEQSLTRYLRQDFPEVRSAEIRGTNFMGGELILSLRQPIIAWKIGDRSYYVDDEGAAFLTNHYSTPPLVVKDQSGIDPTSNVLASERTLRFIGRTVSLINESTVGTVSEVIIPPNKTREVDLKLRGKGYVIKTQLDRDPAGQAMDVINAVRYFNTRAITPRYIDVRVSSQAFYQ